MTTGLGAASCSPRSEDGQRRSGAFVYPTTGPYRPLMVVARASTNSTRTPVTGVLENWFDVSFVRLWSVFIWSLSARET